MIELDIMNIGGFSDAVFNVIASSEPARVVELQKLWDAWSAQQAEPTVRDQPAANAAPKKNAKKKPAA